MHVLSNDPDCTWLVAVWCTFRNRYLDGSYRDGSCNRIVSLLRLFFPRFSANNTLSSHGCSAATPFFMPLVTIPSSSGAALTTPRSILHQEPINMVVLFQIFQHKHTSSTSLLPQFACPTHPRSLARSLLRTIVIVHLACC